MDGKKQKTTENKVSHSQASAKAENGGHKTANSKSRPMRFDAIVIAKKDLRFNRDEAYAR